MSPRVGSPTPGATRHRPGGCWQPRLAAVRRAGPKLRRRRVADERAPLVRVRAGEQRVERHVEEVGVAVPRLAIGERELRALGHGVDVLGRGVSHGREVEALEQPQLLEEDGRLAPRAGLQHRQPVVVDGERLLVGRLPVAQILLGEQPGVTHAGAVHPLPLLERDDRFGDEAAVPLLHRVVRLGEAAVRLRELRVSVQAAGLRNRQIDLGRGRPLVAEQLLDVADGARDRRNDRIAVLRVVDRVLRHLGERQRAVIPQHRHPAAERAGDDGGERPGAGDERQPELVAVARDRRRARRRPLRAEHDRLAALDREQDRRQIAARPVQMRLDHLQRQPGRDRRVERVAALLEHRHAGRGREPVRRRDHPEGAAQLGSCREHRVEGYALDLTEAELRAPQSVASRMILQAVRAGR